MSGEVIDRKVYQIHSKVMTEFMTNNRCYDIGKDYVVDCVRETLSGIGLSVKEITFFDLDGNATQSIDNARYVRVVATSNEVGGEQVFTFALIRLRDRYRVLYLQSAVKES